MIEKPTVWSQYDALNQTTRFGLGQVFVSVSDGRASDAVAVFNKAFQDGVRYERDQVIDKGDVVIVLRGDRAFNDSPAAVEAFCSLLQQVS